MGESMLESRGESRDEKAEGGEPGERQNEKGNREPESWLTTNGGPGTGKNADTTQSRF